MIGGFLAMLYDSFIYNFSPHPFLESLTFMETLAHNIFSGGIYFVSGFLIVFSSLLLYEFLFGIPSKSLAHQQINKSKLDLGQSNK